MKEKVLAGNGMYILCVVEFAGKPLKQHSAGSANYS